MITLFMDTSFRYLNLAVFKEARVLASLHKEAFKSQSEIILVEIDQMFKALDLIPTDIDSIVLTDGPGSYTGLRISMSIAKVLCTLSPIKLYTLSSLQAMAGLHDEVGVIMDARAERVYCALYRKGQVVIEPMILPIVDAQALFKEKFCVGDADLINQERSFYDISQQVFDLKAQWKPIDSMHDLVPKYLKDSV